MPVDALVRVSFNADANANNKARYALTGTINSTDPEAPFQKVGTAAFSANDADEKSVAEALQKLSKVLVEHHNTIDSLALTLVKF